MQTCAEYCNQADTSLVGTARRILAANPIAWLAAMLVPLLHVLLYTPLGMDSTDFGYFYAYAWRILDGQVPYRDFHYIKPALPLYWHAFWMWLTPDGMNMLGGKLGFVAEVLAASWFAALFCRRFFRLEAIGLSLPLLATLGYVFGAHTFPHMPWHTADGILFAGAALWAAGNGWALAAGLLAACAMLCKQSFVFVPLAVIALAYVCQPDDKLSGKFSGRFAGCLRSLCGWLAMMGLVWLLLGMAGARADFARLTTGQLAIAEALEAGIWIYLRQNWWLPMLALMPWLACLAGKAKCPAWLAPCPVYIGLLALWYVSEALASKAWIGFGTSWPTLFVLLGGLCLVLPGRVLLPFLSMPHGCSAPGQEWRARIGLGSLLLVSWSVAVSGGYKVPALFATPLVLAFVLVHAMLQDHAKLAQIHAHVVQTVAKSCQRLAWASLCLGLVMFHTGFQYPYVFPVRPMPRTALVHDAGQIYPRANGIMVDADMLARLAELRQLRAKYGPRYKTLPGFCQAYYLNGDHPLGRSDWLIDWEINAEATDVYQDLLDKKLVVFMERDQMESKQADAYARAGYTVPQMVRHKWRIIDETGHFVVFAPPR